MDKNDKKIRILLVDDDEMMQIYFRDIFWIHGKSNFYDIKMASTLAEAEKIIHNEETRPNTIFLDVLMSSHDGKSAPAYHMARALEFISKVKKDPNLANINIIVFSGQKEQYLKEAAQGVGIDGYLIKGELMPREIVAFTDKIHGTNH